MKLGQPLVGAGNTDYDYPCRRVVGTGTMSVKAEEDCRKLGMWKFGDSRWQPQMSRLTQRPISWTMLFVACCVPRALTAETHVGVSINPRPLEIIPLCLHPHRLFLVPVSLQTEAICR